MKGCQEWGKVTSVKTNKPSCWILNELESEEGPLVYARKKRVTVIKSGENNTWVWQHWFNPGDGFNLEETGLGDSFDLWYKVDI